MGGISHCHSTPIQFKTPLVPNGWLLMVSILLRAHSQQPTEQDCCASQPNVATQCTICTILAQLIGPLLAVDKGQKTTIPYTLTVGLTKKSNPERK